MVNPRRLQDRVVRVAEIRDEVALDKLDRLAQVMRSLRRPVSGRL
jgi:hypothetical protein